MECGPTAHPEEKDAPPGGSWRWQIWRSSHSARTGRLISARSVSRQAALRPRSENPPFKHEIEGIRRYRKRAVFAGGRSPCAPRAKKRDFYPGKRSELSHTCTCPARKLAPGHERPFFGRYLDFHRFRSAFIRHHRRFSLPGRRKRRIGNKRQRTRHHQQQHTQNSRGTAFPERDRAACVHKKQGS